jgi:hypothetical protein
VWRGHVRAGVGEWCRLLLLSELVHLFYVFLLQLLRCLPQRTTANSQKTTCNGILAGAASRIANSASRQLTVGLISNSSSRQLTVG